MGTAALAPWRPEPSVHQAEFVALFAAPEARWPRSPETRGDSARGIEARLAARGGTQAGALRREPRVRDHGRAVVAVTWEARPAPSHQWLSTCRGKASRTWASSGICSHGFAVAQQTRKLAVI